MMLTRRDALSALLAGGGLGVGLSQIPPLDGTGPSDGGEMADDDVRTLVAVAEVVYPSAATPTDEFVENYVGGLPTERTQNVLRTVRALDAHARRDRGRPFSSLSKAQRDALLRSMGVDRTGPNPEGVLSERVRYYVVNQLLYGLYTSPRGGSLLGTDNPFGHPGGYESYQKPPSESTLMEQ